MHIHFYSKIWSINGKFRIFNFPIQDDDDGPADWSNTKLLPDTPNGMGFSRHTMYTILIILSTPLCVQPDRFTPINSRNIDYTFTRSDTHTEKQIHTHRAQSRLRSGWDLKLYKAHYVIATDYIYLFCVPHSTTLLDWIGELLHLQALLASSVCIKENLVSAYIWLCPPKCKNLPFCTIYVRIFVLK